MSENQLHLTTPPIIEAVVDIDCDMPPKFDLPALEKTVQDAFKDRYLHFRSQFMAQFQIKAEQEGATLQNKIQGVQAFQLHQEDRAQLIQVRTEGFSFNRLRPYTTLDDYLNEIQNCWTKFVEITRPVQVRAVRLRYINRILLPLQNGTLDIQDYIQVCPKLPGNSNLVFSGFLNQHSAIEKDTRNEVSIVLTTQNPEKDDLPILFDITVASPKSGEINNWSWILEQILSLRSLKNRIFENTLTEKCLNLFRPLV